MVSRYSVFLVLGLIGLFVQEAFPQENKDFDPFAENAEEALEKLLGNLQKDEEKEEEPPSFLEPGRVETLTELVRPALVTVRQIGRDGDRMGTGSGFVVADTGLIATNLHVIGEGRPVEIEFAGGETRRVVEITASDKRFDLAIVRIEPGDLKLTALPIAGEEAAIQGRIIVGFGAPRGLEFSVVPGVISAVRTLDEDFLGAGEDSPDFPMLQIAMPIEQGNSGGPIVTLDGAVVGVVTLKHRKTRNLGFAVPSNDLQQLIDKPNPVSMGRWQTIGALNQKQWQTLMGAQWTQRGGVITAENLGEGFGGRSVCISRSDKVPDEPYEISVSVRLDDEAGAAGLAFASDGDQKHYGFYPSSGRLRLTRFEGPDVYSWTILEQIDTEAYLPGDWNELRVRVDKEKIFGWVNGQLVLEIRDDGLRGGSVGLCKFRGTVAEFRNWRIGKDLSPPGVDKELETKLTKAIDAYVDEGSTDALSETLQKDAIASRRLLEEKAEALDELAAKVRALRRSVHVEQVSGELAMALEKSEAETDLFEIGLQIARIDDPELDLDHYRTLFGQLVQEASSYIKDKTGAETGNVERVEALRKFLFEESGFHGSRSEYYHHANSYLNQVLDDREGIPITLSVLFVEMARRLGIEGVFGASVPGHFLIGFREDKDSVTPTTFFDAFEGGKEMPVGDLIEVKWKEDEVPEYFQPATARHIATRMLRNLILIEVDQRNNPEGASDYLDLLLAINPESARERFQRALIRLQKDDTGGARSDIDWLLERRPPGINYRRLEQFREQLEEE